LIKDILEMECTLKGRPSTLLRKVIILSLFCALACFAGCGSRKKPSAVVEEMCRTIERGEVDQAAKFYSQAFISRIGIDSIKESSRQTALWIKRDGGIKSIEVLKEDTVGEVAEISIKITRGGGDSSVVHYKLVWETGGWKIDGLASDPTLPTASATPSLSV
jgi:hypothetical protein